MWPPLCLSLPLAPLPGGLLPAHALPLERDLPHAARARGAAAQRCALRALLAVRPLLPPLAAAGRACARRSPAPTSPFLFPRLSSIICSAEGGPDWLPHVRLRAPLCVRLHTHPGAGGHARGCAPPPAPPARLRRDAELPSQLPGPRPCRAAEAPRCRGPTELAPPCRAPHSSPAAACCPPALTACLPPPHTACLFSPRAGVEDNGSLTRVAAFPIGIDPDRFTEALEMPEVKANIAQLLNRCACCYGFVLLCCWPWALANDACSCSTGQRALSRHERRRLAAGGRGPRAPACGPPAVGQPVCPGFTLPLARPAATRGVR